MKVLKDLRCEVTYTNTHYFGLDEMSCGESPTLLYGYTLLENPVKRNGPTAYLNVTMPTEFCSSQPTDSDRFFDRIYGICPYTVEWLGPRYQFVWYPFHESDIPKVAEKKYDVCYHGGIHGQTYIECLDAISKFSYRYMSMTHGINHMTSRCLGRATDLNLSNSQKLQRISECKISVCYNTFPIRGYEDLHNIKNRDRWFDNRAFSHIESEMIAPQIKSRLNESAFCRTLNLVKRDHWNLVERFYAEDEFVYFDSNEELVEKIESILSNWSDYAPMIDRAYNRSLNYTSRNLYEKIKYEMSMLS